MKSHSFFGRFKHPIVPRNTAFALVLLAFLAWCSSALCDPIHDAARKGDLAKVKALVKDNPALISSMDKSGYTAMHIAAYNDHADVVAFLLDSGAEVNARSKIGGFTPLDQALACFNHKDTVPLLLAHGADVNSRADNGMTPLHNSAVRGLKDDADLLIAHGADVYAKDRGGSTPLEMAIQLGRTNVAELLVSHMADVNGRDNGGNTPLYWAKMRGNAKLEELLRQHGGHE